MDKKKIALISIIVLEVIIFLIVLIYTIEGLKAKKEDLSVLNTVIEDNLNKIIDVNTKEENVIENTVEENIIEESKEEEPIVDPEQEIDMNTLQKEESNQEKAEQIAREAWGNDNSVVMVFDHIDRNGRYVVFVMKETTRTQVDQYVVDINTGTIVQ